MRARRSGNTERIAGYISDQTGASPEGVAGVTAADLEACDSIIVGAPTWNTGADDMRSGTDIDSWLYDVLPSADLKGKKVALFGCGDQAGYSGNFCDSVGELYDCFTARGATVVGFRAAKGCEIPNFKGSYLGRFSLVSADFWTSDHLSERSRSVDAFSRTRARGTLTLKRR